MRSFQSLLAALVLAFCLIAQVTVSSLTQTPRTYLSRTTLNHISQAQSSTMSNSSMSTMSTSTKSSSASSSSTESGSAATGTQGFPPMTGGNSGSGDAGGGTSGGTGNTSSVTPSSTKSGAGMGAVVGEYERHVWLDETKVRHQQPTPMLEILILLFGMVRLYANVRQAQDIDNYTYTVDRRRVCDDIKYCFARIANIASRNKKPQAFAPRPSNARPRFHFPDSTLGRIDSMRTQSSYREWNRSPIRDLFPRIPAAALERVLDLCIARPFTYNLSQSKLWNARHLTSIVVAHVRHAYSDYDKLLREQQVERFEARHRTAERVWKVLREWCPWEQSNEVLERCFRVTLLRPEERQPADAEWDPMDIDDHEEPECVNESEFVDDPMEID
ncbi:hypothetical protein LTR59_002005 [Friedmanniomyces endolithicus]|nr:hypothetical protein LTR94_010756 [Friedmanniomyces endolithicus]KAK0793179.1 hypothetical protein LTR38_009656 [Friedmanniomyces endolithicus]KAK0810994.1 hypothetical protein LTR59_002005 [Friedmanniomyces endolithicus]